MSDNEKCIADVILADLCADFRGRCPADNHKPLPPELDDLILACLMVATERGPGTPVATVQELNLCLNLVSGRWWGDQLAWLLAMEHCVYDGKNRARNELSDNLNHHQSNIRGWMFNLAWFIRHELDRDEVVPRLLENTAGTLGGWDMSLGLCRALFDNDELFEQATLLYQPEDYAQQYHERIEHAKKQGYARYLYPFEMIELRLRRLIDHRIIRMATST